jgi:hypothetical protein
MGQSGDGNKDCRREVGVTSTGDAGCRTAGDAHSDRHAHLRSPPTAESAMPNVPSMTSRAILKSPRPLRDRGLTAEEIEKVYSGNWLAVLCAVLS